MGKIRNGRFQRNLKPNPFQIGDIHIAILDTVYKYRYVTYSQITTLNPRWKESSFKAPVRQLYNGDGIRGYLLKPRCQRPPGIMQNRESIYMLGDRGADALREAFDIYISDTDRDVLEGADTIKNFKHDLILSKYLVTLRLFGRDTNIGVNYTWDMVDKGILSDNDDATWHLGKKRIIPDMPLLLEKDGKKKLILIEMDRSTEPQVRNTRGSSIERKFLKYMQAYNNGLHTKTYGMKTMRVLFITSSNQRIDNMRKLTVELGIRDRIFLFTTSKAVLADNPLTHEYTTNKDELTTLV